MSVSVRTNIHRDREIDREDFERERERYRERRQTQKGESATCLPWPSS